MLKYTHGCHGQVILGVNRATPGHGHRYPWATFVR